MPAANRAFLSKREFVYATLRADIMNGVRTPGQRLVIDELAAELGVSPIPVREALQELQHDGLVAIEPYVGAHVTELDAEVIREVFALLESFEVISGQAACQCMDDAEFQSMETLLRTMDAHVDDLEQWSEDNVRLHQFICDCAGMTLLPTMLQQVLDHWQRLRRHYLEDVMACTVQTAQAEHWQLLAALRTRNPEHVATVIHEHNQRALDTYIAHLQKTGDVTV